MGQLFYSSQHQKMLGHTNTSECPLTDMKALRNEVIEEFSILVLIVSSCSEPQMEQTKIICTKLKEACNSIINKIWNIVKQVLFYSCMLQVYDYKLKLVNEMCHDCLFTTLKIQEFLMNPFNCWIIILITQQIPYSASTLKLVYNLCLTESEQKIQRNVLFNRAHSKASKLPVCNMASKREGVRNTLIILHIPMPVFCSTRT